jgi:hypothetical protein
VRACKEHMIQLHWRDPRDGQPWIIRVHIGEPSVLGARAVATMITFQQWESLPAVIHSAELSNEIRLEMVTDSELMDLLDEAKDEGAQA